MRWRTWGDSHGDSDSAGPGVGGVEGEGGGWAKAAVTTDAPSGLTDALHAIASALNRSPTHNLPSIQRLSPKPKSEARRRTLSGRFGLGDFPLHCDTSHWPTPCRYVVLACERPGTASAATTLLEAKRVAMSPLQLALAHSTPFIIENGRGSFYSTVFSSTRRFTRMDPGCMIPLDETGFRVLERFTYANNADHMLDIAWERGEILAIDNWRFLHGRTGSVGIADDRLLLRILVQ